MTPSQLKNEVESRGTETHYFDRKTMRYFGDTMRNYGVRGPVTVETIYGPAQAWELYRRRAVKAGNKESAFFDCQTFERVFPK